MSEEAASAFAVVVAGSEGGLPVGGREDSSSPELAAEELSGTKGNDGRNSDGRGEVQCQVSFGEARKEEVADLGLQVRVSQPWHDVWCWEVEVEAGKVGQSCW